MVTGKRGYAATVPDAVFNGLLVEAAAEFVPSIASKLDMGTISMSEADVKQTFDPDALGAQADRWQAQFDRVVRDYTLIRVGL